MLVRFTAHKLNSCVKKYQWKSSFLIGLRLVQVIKVGCFINWVNMCWSVKCLYPAKNSAVVAMSTFYLLRRFMNFKIYIKCQYEPIQISMYPSPSKKEKRKTRTVKEQLRDQERNLESVSRSGYCQELLMITKKSWAAASAILWWIRCTWWKSSRSLRLESLSWPCNSK